MRQLGRFAQGFGGEKRPSRVAGMGVQPALELGICRVDLPLGLGDRTPDAAVPLAGIDDGKTATRAARKVRTVGSKLHTLAVAAVLSISPNIVLVRQPIGQRLVSNRATPFVSQRLQRSRRTISLHVRRLDRSGAKRKDLAPDDTPTGTTSTYASAPGAWAKARLG